MRPTEAKLAEIRDSAIACINDWLDQRNVRHLGIRLSQVDYMTSQNRVRRMRAYRLLGYRMYLVSRTSQRWDEHAGTRLPAWLIQSCETVEPLPPRLERTFVIRVDSGTGEAA